MKFSTKLDKYLNTRKLNSKEKAIYNTVVQTKDFLHKNKKILIMNPEKGNVTVALEGP